MGIHIMAPLYKQVITPPVTELIVYALDGDGYVGVSDGVYETIRTAPNATVVNIVADTLLIQTNEFAPVANVHRTVIPFAALGLPAGATLDEVILSLYGQATTIDGADPFTAVVVNADGLAAALEAADYGRLLAKTVYGGSIISTSLTTIDYNDFALTPAGKLWIPKNAAFKLALRSDFDILAHAHWGGFTFYAADKGWLDPADHTLGYKPKLTVRYYVQ